jgi:tRNA G18 (ribose-2'-O)-methylase SpoU
VGVGPWEGPWPAEPELSLYDEALLAGGDRRNVVDRYRYWRHEAIVRDLDANRYDFHVAVENWGHDFNIGSVIRTANAFNAKAFHIVGKRRWNRRGAMVTDRYQHEYHHPTVEDLVAWAAAAPSGGGAHGIPIIGIDNLPGSQPIETYDLPRACILLFGQEGPGLSRHAREASQVILDIAQFGSTRSINAGAAAAIAMHAWVRRHVFDQPL